MSNTTEFARRLRRAEKTTPMVGYEMGQVVQTSPLTISLYGGEMMASAPLLLLTGVAAERIYTIGDEVVCIVTNSGVLLIDKAVRV